MVRVAKHTQTHTHTFAVRLEKKIVYNVLYIHKQNYGGKSRCPAT